MGGAVKGFFKGVAKAVVSHVGGLVPVVGTPIANYINSKYAKGSFDVGSIGVAIPDGQGVKPINTPAQLKALVEKFPEEAQKAGLTKDMITQEVKDAKEQAKAIGGLIKMKRPHYPHGTGDVSSGDDEKHEHEQPHGYESFADYHARKDKFDKAFNKEKKDKKMAFDEWKKYNAMAKARKVEPSKYLEDKYLEKKFAKGGKVRSKAQMEATARLVALNRARKAKK